MAEVLELAEQLYAALEADDPGPFLSRCAPDATVEYPAAGRLPYGGSWAGREAIGRFLDAHEAAEEILAFEHGDMAATGDVVFVLGHFEGRAQDTGRTWSTSFVHVLQFRDGLLERWQSFFDTAAALDAHG